MGIRVGTQPVLKMYAGLDIPTFSPADIAKYWWTADAGVTESGGAVSAWVDNVGGLSINQANPTFQPTLVTSTNLNNQNAIRFDGVNDYLQRSPLSFASDGYAFSWVMITYWASTTINKSAMAQSYFGANPGRIGFVNLGAPFNGIVYIGEGFQSTANPVVETPVTTGTKVAMFEYDGAGNTRGWYNDFNTTNYTDTGGNVNQDLIQTTSFLLGAYNNTSTGVDNGFRWQGDLAEVIFVPRTLTAGDITNLQTYINTKYGTSV